MRSPSIRPLHLLTFGSSVLDELLDRAHVRGRVALAYLDDMIPAAETVARQVRYALHLPDQVSLRIDTARPLYVTHTLFWFEATYTGDIREQALYCIAVDRDYGRLVRHLEPFLDGRRLSDARLWPYPDASSLPLGRAYVAARGRVARTVATGTASRSREIGAAVARQSERTVQYFADLRAELRARLEKAGSGSEQRESLRLRLDAVGREEALRLEDLRRKAALRVDLRLRNILHLKALRLFLTAQPVAAGRDLARTAPLNLTWDPVGAETPRYRVPSLPAVGI